MREKKNDVLMIILMYVVIALSGLASLMYIPMPSEVLSFLVADLVMTVVCFTFSMWKRNSSVYDAYWSVIPFYFVLIWAVLYSDALDVHRIIAFIVISIWSWRLTLNWVRLWHGFEHEDWRYVDLAEKTGVFYPLVSFSGIHLFPTLLVFGGMWPLFYMMQQELIEPVMFWLGCGISLLGTWLEFSADNDLARFRKRKNPKQTDLLEVGLWGRCRHPNYLGEMLFWIGMGLIGLAYGAPTYTLSGALAMVLLFNFISIKLKEDRMKVKRPEQFESYRKRVPRLIPKIF